MADAVYDFDHFIALDRQSIRFQLVAGTLLIIIGALVIIGAFTAIAPSEGGNLEVITKSIGSLVSLAGLYPFSNCWSRWERIKTLQAMRLNPGALDPDSMHELVRKLYFKFVGV
jgi:hypothetical protein